VTHKQLGLKQRFEYEGSRFFRWRVRVDQRVSAFRAVEVPVLVCLRSS